MNSLQGAAQDLTLVPGDFRIPCLLLLLTISSFASKENSQRKGKNNLIWLFNKGGYLLGTEKSSGSQKDVGPCGH